MPSASPDTLHPIIARFVRESAAEMSAEQASVILGQHRTTTARLCERGQIECTKLTNARGDGLAARYTITRAALMAYIIKATHGPRESLMHSIATLCPQWTDFAQRIASGRSVAMTNDECGMTNGLPPNVIPMRKHRVLEDPYKGHPELFPAAQQAG